MTSSTDGATATILMTAECSDGIALADAANEPGLASDCEALLDARDALAGTATLNWSTNAAMTAWEGVTIGGTPKRATVLDLSGHGLSGVIPSGLSELAKLQRLDLASNGLVWRVADGARGSIQSDQPGAILPDISQMEFSASMIATRHGNTDYMAVL